MREWELVFNVPIFLDIVVTFFTALEEESGYITEFRAIAVNYISSYFILDVLAVVPGLASLESVKSIYFLKLLRLLQLKRIF